MPIERAIVVENKWRAQRYGVHGTFVGHGGAISVAEIWWIRWSKTSPKTPRRSAASTSCGAAAPSSDAGTSADAQIAMYEKIGKTDGRARALAAVTDWLAETTLQ